MTSPRAPRFQRDQELAACLLGRADLQVGLVGPAVAAVQQALMDLGYSLNGSGPDGVFGTETGDAVAAFSADTLGGPDRVVRSSTMRALDRRFARERAKVPDLSAPEAVARAALPVDGAPGADGAAAAAASRAVDLALAEVAAGSHFLAGSAGAAPEAGGGTMLRPSGVTLASGRTDPADPVVFAAQADGTLCAGRWNARNGGIAGGRPARNTDTDLIVYLGGLAARPEPEWTPFFGFFSPRRVEGVPGATIVWGEECRGKRHFDGPNLIIWCWETSTGQRRPIAFEPSDPARDGALPVPIGDPPRRGDIVVRSAHEVVTHSGFLTDDDPPRVVLAEQPGVGVVVRRFTPAGWTSRWRPTASLLGI